MNAPVRDERKDRLLQSVDLAVRDLLIGGDDPLTLALYLWTMREHDVRLVNGDGLVSWGAAWARQIFVDGRIGRRRDEEIASAALAVAALAGTSALADVENAIRDGLGWVTSAELDSSIVPFQHSGYAALLLLAAVMMGIDEPRLSVAAGRVTERFLVTMPGGRLFGIGFIARLLVALRATDSLEILRRRAESVLRNPGVAYEDQVYVAQALWQLDVDQEADPGIAAEIEHVCVASPGWHYLMVGVEEIAPAGDGQVGVVVSHLYRATLLDLLLRLDASAARRAADALDARYRGRRLVSLAAFCFIVVLVVIPALGLARVASRSIEPARQYWLFDNYSAMSAPAALLALGGAVMASLYLVEAVAIVFKAGQLLIGASIESDRRIVEELGRSLLGTGKMWMIVVAVAVIVNLLTGTIGPAFQHAIGGK